MFALTDHIADAVQPPLNGVAAAHTGEHEVAIKLYHDVTAQLVFQVKSAEGPRERGAEANHAAADEPEKRKKPGFFRRKKEEKKETE